MEIGEFSAFFFFFSVSFYPLLSLASGLTPSGHFWGKRRGNKAGEKSLVSGQRQDRRSAEGSSGVG